MAALARDVLEDSNVCVTPQRQVSPPRLQFLLTSLQRAEKLCLALVDAPLCHTRSEF